MSFSHALKLHEMVAAIILMDGFQLTSDGIFSKKTPRTAIK